MRRLLLSLVVAAALAGAAGCAPQRFLRVESYPSGAVVRLDEQVIGRTPLEHPFQDYGVRRVTLYLPGYRTWSRRIELRRPWHARFPVDLVTEVVVPLGLRDDHYVWVILEGDEALGGEPNLGPLIERAREMREHGAQLSTERPAPPER